MDIHMVGHVRLLFYSPGARLGGRRAAPRARGLALAFTRYCFASKLHCGSLSSLDPPPPATPTLLKYHCTHITQYTPPPADPLFVYHTRYNIGNGNIMQRLTPRVSCSRRRSRWAAHCSACAGSSQRTGPSGPPSVSAG